jgi:hypothetical protein
MLKMHHSSPSSPFRDNLLRKINYFYYKWVIRRDGWWMCRRALLKAQFYGLTTSKPLI